MIENFLELDGGLRSLALCEKSLASHVGRIETADESEKGDAWYSQFIGRGDLQQLNRFQRLVVMQSENGAQCRQIHESDLSILRESPFKFFRERFRLRKIPYKGQCKGRAILHISGLRKPQGFGCVPPGRRRVAEESF